MIFDHKGKKYININGKDFYLLRGYYDRKRWRDGNPIFLQVYGRSPLNPEDLGNDWDIIKTKLLEGKLKESKFIYTAFKPKLFEYSPIKEDEQYKKIFFIGMNEQGSLFLAFNFLRECYKIKINEKQMMGIIKKFMNGKQDHYYHHEPIQKIEDQGNSQIPAYYMEFEKWKMNEEKAREIFEIEKKG